MPVPLRQFSDYFLENISVRYTNQLQISSVCNGRCFFCSNEQNPFPVKRCEFRDIGEIEKVLWAMPKYTGGSFSLNESLPGRISEGEALLHPQLFDILSLIRSKFNNQIYITTNGSLLDEFMVSGLAQFRPVEIRISIPTMTPEHWMNTFNLNEESCKTALNAIPLLLKYNISVLPTLVPMPSWLGYEDIENTIANIATYGIPYILVYAPGYTRYTKPEVVDKLKYDKDELSKFFSEMSELYSVCFEWDLDPNKELKVNPNLISNALHNMYSKKITKSHWFTSKSAYKRFKALVESSKKNIPVQAEVVPVENKTYGGNIECAGLFMINDIKETLQDLNLNNEYIILPELFLDRYGYDLQGENIVDFKKECNNDLTFL